MPKAFNECQAAGGKIRTVKPKAGTYVHVCKSPGSSTTVAGEVHHNKAKPKSAKRKRASKTKSQPSVIYHPGMKDPNDDTEHEYR